MSVLCRTLAARRYEDDIDELVKQRRLEEVIETFRRHERSNRIAEVGRIHLVLVEGESKREPTLLTGRTDTFKVKNSSRALSTKFSYVLTVITF